MDRSTLYIEIDDLLQLPKGTIRGDQALKKVRHWDSLAVISFIVLANERYGVSLVPNEVGACQTVEDLALTIEKHQK